MRRDVTCPGRGLGVAVNFNRVLVLAEIVQCGSLSLAAKRMGLTQSALSQQVARFEEELGIQLLERDGRGVQPTKAGLRVAEAAGMLHNVEGFVNGAIASVQNGAEACLEMFCYRSASLAVLPRALKLFTDALPGTHISVKEISTYPELTRTWQSGSCELGLVHEQTFFATPAVGAVDRKVLLTESMSVLVRSDNPLVARKSVTLSDLRDEYWVVEQNASVGYLSFASAAQLAGFTPRERCRSSALEIVASLVASGGGIALVPTVTGPPRLPGTVLIPLVYPEITRTLVSVTPTGVKSAAAQVLEDALIETSSQLLKKCI